MREVSCHCCCCRHHHKGSKTIESTADPSKLKSEENVCDICGQNVPLKEFCGVKRLRCPCHTSGPHCNGVFESHSREILGIHVSGMAADFYFVLFSEKKNHFPFLFIKQYVDDAVYDENDHGKKPPRNPKYPWLDWRLRPLITNVSVDEKHFTWHLKRKTPAIPDIYFQEMYDLNRRRYF